MFWKEKRKITSEGKVDIMARYRKVYVVEGAEEEIHAIDIVFSRINQMILYGSSGSVNINVDADGSARLFCKEENGDMIEFSKDLTKQIKEAEGKKEFPIGVKGCGMLAEIKKNGQEMEVWIGE